MAELIHKEESYKIIGICMEVHNNLGPGFLEVVYKDALEYEFLKASIPYQREKKYDVRYKDILLPHNFYADFVAASLRPQKKGALLSTPSYIFISSRYYTEKLSPHPHDLLAFGLLN